MNSILKYTLETIDEQTIQIPQPAEILSVKEQNGNMVLYAIADLNKKAVPIHIKIVGTGHPFEDFQVWNFIDTVKLLGGKIMFHVFQKD